MTQAQPLAVDYAHADYPVRKEIGASHQKMLSSFANAGTWWTGAERTAIAAESRAARDCALCAERKAALSPFSVEVKHNGPGKLAPEVVDVIHRIVTDPGRLARSWFDGVMAEGALSAERYIELISVTVLTNAIDVFAYGMGLDCVELPEPEAGEPSRVRPKSARVDGAWVPQIPAGEDGGEEHTALYGDRKFVPQVGRALSLVPDEVRMLYLLSSVHYMPIENVSNPGYNEPNRAIDRLQMELIASRVSAINECFY